jgi:hypothetical protein
MAPYLRIAVRVLGVGAILVIIAVVSRQVYLRIAADADLAGMDKEPLGKDVDPLRDDATPPPEAAQARGHGGC